MYVVQLVFFFCQIITTESVQTYSGGLYTSTVHISILYKHYTHIFNYCSYYSIFISL